MLSNRVKFFIRNILQNSKLNREKFVQNKKTYKNILLANDNINKLNKLNKMQYNNKNNFIVRRNFGTYNFNVEPTNKFGKRPGGPNGFIVAFLTAVSIYFINGKFKTD